MTADLQAPLVRHRFSVADYQKMIDTGVLSEEDHVELLNGEIVEMSPIKSPHAAIVKRLNRLLQKYFGNRYLVSIQDPIIIRPNSQPQPDIAVLKYRDDYYYNEHPRPEDIILLIEVADSSLEKDRKIKLPLYAAAGIQEAWLVDIASKLLEVHTKPTPQGYSQVQIFRAGDVLQSPSVDSLAVDDILRS